MNFKTFNVQRSTFSVQRWLLLTLLTCSLSHLLTFPAQAATEIRAFVTITNTPAGLTSNLVINIGTATTRYWTNSAAAAPSINIQTTNSTAASATNLLVHLVDYPLYSIGSSGPQLGVGYVSSNTSTLVFTAPLNTNLTVTFGGNWARVIYDTNIFADASPILSVTNSMSPRLRTNAMNSIVNLLASGIVPSNSFPPANYAFRHYTDNTSAQTVSNKTLTGAVLTGGRLVNATNLTGTNVALTNAVFYLVNASGVTVWSGFATAVTNGSFWSNLFHASQISNAVAIGGVVHRLTNGYATNLTLGSPKTTNLINYGNAISSVGLGTSSEQFGAGAVAGSDYNTALGAGATTTNLSATAVGRQSTASDSATAIGSLATANTNSVGVGYGARAAGYGNVVVGSGADDNDYANVILIGKDVTASADNEVRIATSSQVVKFGGPIAPEATITNATLRGTNVINARLDLTSRANTSLANGYNSGVIFGTNTYIRFSGPTAAYTNAGFAAPGGPQYVLAQFDNPGLSFTLLNESGLEVTAANRILTGTGSATPLNSTNNPVMATFLYDDTASRWRILSFR